MSSNALVIDSGLTQVVDDLYSILSKERSVDFPSHVPNRTRVRALLTIRSPLTPLDPKAVKLTQQLLSKELQSKSLTQAAQLPRVTRTSNDALSRISVWRGDITSLVVDGIVNAANSQLLGCFQPTHRCIDNVIHDAAGPELRAACLKLMQEQGHEEDVGKCKITPAYQLPSKFVLHTVGPQLPRSQKQPSPKQQQQLRNCYLSCLDTAAANNLTSLAFCCISTGLFGYPSEEGAIVAVQTVKEWLEKHPNSKLQHVIFDAFLEKDEQMYQQIFEKLLNPATAEFAFIPSSASEPDLTPPSASFTAPLGPDGIPIHIKKSLTISKQIVAQTTLDFPAQLEEPEGVDVADLDLAAQWLKQGSSLLLCGAAGLSASVGLDYTSEEVCASLFPAMAQHDFHTFYQAIGKHDWSDELAFGYLMQHMYLARFNWPQSQLYQELKEMAQSKENNATSPATASPEGSSPASSSSSPSPNASSWENSFVYTSNADGMFAQNGFPKSNIYTVQGDYSIMQCFTPCRPDAYWDAKPIVEQALTHIDPATQMIPSQYVPKCPHCGGKAFMNVRGGDWFLEEQPHKTARNAYSQFLRSKLAEATPEKPLVIVEIGAGFNTPGVIRLPMERLAKMHANVRLIRINAHYPQVPTQVERTRAIGLAGEANEIVHYLYRELMRK